MQETELWLCGCINIFSEFVQCRKSSTVKGITSHNAHTLINA
jgi:hypothetical protein